MLTAEADARRIGTLVESLAQGIVPAMAADFTWRAKPASAADFAQKVAAIGAMQLAVLETRIVPAAATAEIGGLLQEFSGLPAREGDRLVVVTVQFQDHVISWGLVVDGSDALRAWFDPSPLLQLIAP